MNNPPNNEIPGWFKPQAETIYLSLRMMAVAHKATIDLYVSEAQLQAARWKNLADTMAGPDASLEQLKAEFDRQRDTLSERAESIKNMPMVAVQAIDQIDALLERCGIKIPPEPQG